MNSNGMSCFKRLESHLRSLYQNRYAHVRRPRLVEMTFCRFFGEEHQTFRKKTLHNLDQFQLQFKKENYHAEHFRDYMGTTPATYRESSGIESENNNSEKALNKSINETHMQMQEGKVDMGKALDVGLVVTKSSRTKSDKQDTSNRSGNYTTHIVDADMSLVNDQEPFVEMQEGKVDMGKALDVGLVVTKSSRTKSDKQDTSNRSGNYTTHIVDADMSLVNDQEPFVEVQLTAQHNVLVNEQQHSKQSEPIYDQYLLENLDSNTTHDSTNMCNWGRIDQNADKCNGYHKKDKIQAKPDKTEHEKESVENSTVNQSQQKSTQSKSKTEPRSKNY
nr:hypothetical protein [Tanacetum cinerariifolium]